MVSKTSVPLASPCAEPGATSQHRGRGTFVTQRFSLVLNSWSLLLLCADVYEVRSHSVRSSSLPNLVAGICLESGNGLPTALALLRTANIGRFNTTEARAGEAPLSISE